MGADMSNATLASMNGRAVGYADTGAMPGASCCQMPLSFMKNGETATIAKVRGKGDLHHHLENLGFVEGARVTVMSEAAGDLIVEVKGTQVALNKQIASRIITSAAA
ncbi:FeoA family protein [Gordonibacter massiliensis (ex Traore et al. 2017)]|uniref:Ferrous iron transport protein A n=1 Tax=Gordonibacter massiliensis (ex Traore et al. 2017) TaxID=1841863 RepID=A0A842JCQ1_9ACTN|nr:FeoA family protein [Gordonibacter massiliensis (ex Traore et al. 2017)]MBC2888271.1 ferrous iron transport protein A [Gordonibacter massiliensis (ex Traore et al. 2017)]